MANPLISIVSPEYKGEKMVHELVTRIIASVETFTSDYEIILVNDGSPDNTWAEIEVECKQNRRVKGLNLSRNFGQHYAITAGLAYATGDWIVVMDCDLQDRPEEIPRLYNKAKEGWDIVAARRVVRHDNFIKKMSSRIFNFLYNWLSGLHKDKAIANFGIYSNSVIQKFNKMPERARSFQTLIGYLGFNHTTLDVQHDVRGEGKSSYSLTKLLRLSLDLILSDSNKPLRIAIWLGFTMSFLSFLLALYNVIANLIGIVQVAGYSSTIFSIWFVGGLVLFMMGILGLYIEKIFDQVKGRPLYIIKNTINISQ